MEGLEKKLFGGSLTFIFIVIYFEIRDLRLRVSNLENIVHKHVFFEDHDECEDKND